MDKKVLRSVAVGLAVSLSASACSLSGGSKDLEPLPAELQSRVIASSSANSRERMSERGIASTSFDPQPLEPQDTSSRPECDPSADTPLPESCFASTTTQ